MSGFLPKELEALVPAIDSTEREQEISRLLKKLNGVVAVGVARGSFWLSYQPQVITRREICRTLHEAGYPPDRSLVPVGDAKNT